MMQALIALNLIALIGGLIVAEKRAKGALEADVADYLDGCAITPDTIDVHGRPYLLYAAQHTADLSYVDLDRAKGTNKDQVLVHHLVDGHADRLTRYITFDNPSGQVRPEPQPPTAPGSAAPVRLPRHPRWAPSAPPTQRGAASICARRDRLPAAGHVDRRPVAERRHWVGWR